MRKKEKKLRISELSQMTGVSTSTIRHWVNEGLIPMAYKTGKTMSYYDPSCVERIKFIKKMQREKFLPLDVIRRLINSEDYSNGDLELGETIFTAHTLLPNIQPISEMKISHYTGYEKEKIDLLEKKGLIIPEIVKGERYYDAIDCKMIELIKLREESGLPPDYSIETIEIYFNALRMAIDKDICRFVRSFMGDMPTREAVKMITEADEYLDSLIVLFKQKIRRYISSIAIRELDELPGKVSLISFLPLKGDKLDDGDDLPLSRIVHAFCSGNYDAALELVDSLPSALTFITPSSLSILAYLLKGDIASALDLTERKISEPTMYMAENVAAALAYVFSLSMTSGFSRPIYLAKRAIGYLKRNEVIREQHPLIKLFALYVSGAVYIMLPDVFDVYSRGIMQLEEVVQLIESNELQLEQLSPWIVRMLSYEILPGIEIRVNRFLAEGYIKKGEHALAQKCLERIILLGDADEITEWARLKRIELG